MPKQGNYSQFIVDFGSFDCFNYDGYKDVFVHKNFLKYFNRLVGLNRLDDKLYLFPFSYNKVVSFSEKKILEFRRKVDNNFLNVNSDSRHSDTTYPTLFLLPVVTPGHACLTHQPYRMCIHDLKNVHYDNTNQLYTYKISKDIPQFLIISGKLPVLYVEVILQTCAEMSDNRELIGKNIIPSKNFIKTHVIYKKAHPKFLVDLHCSPSNPTKIDDFINIMKTGQRKRYRTPIEVILHFRNTDTICPGDFIYGII